MNQASLRSIAHSISQKISAARVGEHFYEEPFEHIVLDNFFPVDLALSASRAFPEVTGGLWDYQNDSDIEIKYRSMWQSEFDIPDDILPLVRVMNSSPILSAIGDRLGIPKLVPDPYFTGGGLNVTARSGLLDVHVDGNYHDASGLNRRVNIILYLTESWRDEWGGHFGIYDGSGEVCEKKVAPLFNRAVIFHTHDKSFHGLPDPLRCPEEVTRKSLILYYYTKADRPTHLADVNKPHSALWKKRGLLDKRGNKTRMFS